MVCWNGFFGLIMRKYRLLVSVLLVVSLCACGGYRKGFFSAPYVGDPPTSKPTARTKTETRQMQVVDLGDIRIRVDLYNAVATSNEVWVGIGIPMVPVSVDKNEARKPSTKKIERCITVDFSPKSRDITIKPGLALLLVNKEYRKVKSVKTFRKIDEAKRRWEFVDESAESLNVKQEKRLYFRLCFLTEPFTPDDEIELELNNTVPEIDIPVIRFQKRKYIHPYS